MAIGRIPEPGTGIPESIVDAKGDIITATAADTPARLAVGTTEHRLVAASGEATGLKYVADTTNYAVAAKGDLLVGTAADTLAALTVGANGTTLVADSSEATGLKWAAAAGGGGMTLLASGSIGATGLTLSSISGDYEQLFLKLMDVVPSVSTGMGLRFNSDTGGNYSDFANFQSSTSYVTEASGTATRVGLQYEVFRTSANGAIVTCLLKNYSDTIGYKQYEAQSGFLDNPASRPTTVYRVGSWLNENAITSITFFADAGGSFITSGSYELWGIK